MPSGETTPGLSAGDLAEVRVARAWFWDGYYVRRGVDLQHRFGNQVSTVTDLDVVGYAFNASCLFRKEIGEVKTGQSKTTPRPLDRALWMRGLRELVDAQAGEVTTAFRPNGAIRDVCKTLGVRLQHMTDLDAREARLRIEDVADCGSQGPAVALIRARVATHVKTDPVLERAWWFLISEVWFLDPYDALKRTLGVIRGLSLSWPPDNHHEEILVMRWFFAEAVSIATLNLAIIAGESNTMDHASFQEMATHRLATGDVPFHTMKKLSEQVDIFVGKMLNGVGAPPELITETIGAFAPEPPDYTSPLLELIRRLAAESSTASELPRQMDALLFERLVHRRLISEVVQDRLGYTDASERLIRLVGAFLQGQFQIPDPVKKVLSTPLNNPAKAAPSAPTATPAEAATKKTETTQPQEEAAVVEPTLFDEGEGIEDGSSAPVE